MGLFLSLSPHGEIVKLPHLRPSFRFTQDFCGPFFSFPLFVSWTGRELAARLFFIPLFSFVLPRSRFYRFSTFFVY